MKPEKLNQDVEFLWRRLAEPFEDWVVALPVLFALGVVVLLTLFRSERRWMGLAMGLIVVGIAAAVYIPVALFFKPMFSWWVVLVPMLAVALLYVGLMYFKDAHSVHPLWAAFLGFLRCCVYTILAVVFLLPGCQKFDTNEYHAKVLLLFDVSGSMLNGIDDVPQPGQPASALPTRRDKVLQFLSEKKGPEQEAFLDKVLNKTPVELHRFGSQPDEMQIIKLDEGKEVLVADLDKFLKPDADQFPVPDNLSDDDKIKYRAKINEILENLTTRTNVGGSALQVAKNEANSYLQAIVIISDGQSNVGSDEAVREFLARVGNPKRQVPVFTIGVGEFRTPASIRLDDLQLPEDARPDDKFPVRVPVVATGLPDEEFECYLEVQRIKNAGGLDFTGQKFQLGPKKGKFTGAGDMQKDQIEFEIDLQELTKLKASDEKEATALEGRWKFTAKVKRHPREPFPDEFHVSKPAGEVQIQRKKLRVLLFASGPGRDYQFIRTLFFREAGEKRVELSVFLQQTAKEDHVDQDVDKERLLPAFPNRLGVETKGDDKYLNLAEYDVLIAIDPDWSHLNAQQLKMLQEWVGAHSGGIVFVAGPVHSYYLARPAGADITALQSIYPVVLKDSRLVGTNILHDPARPYPLNFSGYAKEFEFLKLDEEGDSPTAGWDHFFWGGPDKKPASGKDVKPLRGIHNYYPVERVKPGSKVVATFPAAPRIDDGKEEMPYMVTMNYGTGKTLYIGSPESYRLRGYKDRFHERFWIKAARYVSAGSTPQKRYVRLLLPATASAGVIGFEAQLKGRDLLPLSRDVIPTAEVIRLDPQRDEDRKPLRFDLKPRSLSGDWNGWFQASLKITEPGEYELNLPVPGVGETARKRLTVRKPNPEMDNLRTNFAALYQLATKAGPVLNRLPAEQRKEIERLLQPSAGDLPKEIEGEEYNRLFFTLHNADHISKCLVKLEPKRESIKGALEDLWDKGFTTGMTVNAYLLGLIIPLLVGLLGFAILLFLGQRMVAGLFMGGCALISFGFVLTDLIGQPSWVDLPVDFSFVLVCIVTLLAVEWLTRKLLKLA